MLSEGARINRTILFLGGPKYVFLAFVYDFMYKT